MRDLLLSIESMNITMMLGETDTFEQINLSIVYTVEKRWLLHANVHPTVLSKPTEITDTRLTTRWLAMLLTGIILLIEGKKFSDSYKNFTYEKSSWWPPLVLIMCFIIILSETLSSLMSCLLLLPYLEQTGNQYLFSYSLRYALPIILSLWSNVLIFLVGVILYSILAYPTVMFENFHRSFFSYIYNNFQYATYEIFFEIANKGILAYFIYLSLYFYMVLVAHSIIPSVFCALVRMRGAERNLTNKLASLHTRCPHCNIQEESVIGSESNTNINQSEVDITILSPKLSPFVHDRSINSQSRKATEKRKRFFIEEDIDLTESHRKSKR